MFYSFKVGNRNLSTFPNSQKTQINDFQKFINEKPDGFCCACMKLLYPEEKKYRYISSPEYLPCIAWKLEPMVSPKDSSKYLVCATHYNTKEDCFPNYVYPGVCILWLIRSFKLMHLNI